MSRRKGSFDFALTSHSRSACFAQDDKWFGAEARYYCGIGELVWLEAGTDAGLVVGDALCDVVGKAWARGGSGTVVIALSGFSKWSLLGPNPSLINARESGTCLVCQP